jgi:hypothetical protein
MLLLIIFCLFPTILANQLQAHVHMDPRNKFDGRYQIYSPREANGQFFAYNREMVCCVQRDARGISAHFEHIKTFDSTPKRLIFSTHYAQDLDVKACFEIQGYSFVIFQDRKNGEHTIMRANNAKIIKLNNIKIDRFLFDHFSQELLLQIENSIYAINQVEFLSWWTQNNQLPENITINLALVNNLTNSVNDLFIADQKIYLLKYDTIYRQNLFDKEEQYVCQTNSAKFGFLIFPIEEQNSLDLKIAEIDNKAKIIMYIYFSLKIIVIFFTLIFAKKYAQKILKRKRNSSNERELIEFNGAVYPPSLVIKA